MTNEICRAELTDARDIAEIHNAAWQRAYAELAPDLAKEKLNLAHRLKTWNETLLHQPKGFQIFLAKSSGATIGFIGFATSDSCIIHNLYVDPNHQGKGVGGKLLNAAFKEAVAVGSNTAELAVVVGNDKAMMFYQRQGGNRQKEQVIQGDIWRSKNWLIRWDNLAFDRINPQRPKFDNLC